MPQLLSAPGTSVTFKIRLHEAELLGSLRGTPPDVCGVMRGKERDTASGGAPNSACRLWCLNHSTRQLENLTNDPGEIM